MNDEYRTSHGRQLSSGEVEARISNQEVDRRFAMSQLESDRRRTAVDQRMLPQGWETWVVIACTAALVVLALIVGGVALER